MSPPPSKVAVIACLAGQAADGVERRLLGLTVGERLLLALAHAGYEGVAFVGDGPRPSCPRAALRELRPADVDRSQSHLVVASDAVFSSSVLALAEIPAGLPMVHARGSELASLLDQPGRAAAVLADGRADRDPVFAVRVRDAATAAAARRALLRSLRKPIDGLVSRHINRHVSLFLSRFLVGTGVRPNVFTVAFMALGLAAAVVVALVPSGWGLVLGAALFQAQSILDGCDGEMARLTYRFSKQGQWLDSIGDDLTNYAFCLGLAVGQAQLHAASSLFWIAGVTLGMQLASSGLCYRRMIQLGTGDLLAVPDLVTGTGGDGPLAKLVALVRVFFKRDSFVLILAVVTAVQMPILAFYLFAAGTVPVFLGVLLNERRLGKIDDDSASLSMA